MEKTGILTNEEGNDLISNFIKIGEPFGVARIGIGEIHLIHKKIMAILQPSDYSSCQAGGVREDSYEFFFEEYIKGIIDADAHVYWKGIGLESQQNTIFKECSPSSIKIMNRAIEPFYFEKPWSRLLVGKKVLVVNPFKETIIDQHKNLSKIWGDRDVMPEFELLTYKSEFLTSGTSPSWKDTLTKMKDDIGKMDFDIALLGCSLYGLPLMSHIKSIGSSLQLLFGIKGKRWDVHPEIAPMYNEYWVRPKSSEIPQNYRGGDGGTYW